MLATKKNTHRTEKMADEIRKSIAQYLIHGHKDPNIGFVTVTRVKISPDLQQAKVYFTSYGDADERQKNEQALTNSAKEIRHHIAQDINARYTPVLEFFYDDELEEAYRMERIFREIGQSSEEKK